MSKPVDFTIDQDLEISVTCTVTKLYVNNRVQAFVETCGPEVENLHIELVFGNSRINITKLLHSRDLDAIVEQSIKEALK